MGFPVMLPLRGVQAVFNIIELGLVAYAVHQYTRTYCLYDSIYSNSRSCGAGSSPSELSFLLFNTIWTMLAIVYLTLSVTVLPKFGHKIAILVVDAVTMIFWFAGFIAMAVIVGEADRLTGSYTSRSTLRQVTRATVAFAAFLW
ncbi:MAG: hypothetical protein M1833_002910 [Piccolia ochrophora]|nr:MAG: hypothetical protein M1833_002910 [Piccolia ochrophora]